MLQDTLHNLPDIWTVKEDVQVTHLHTCTVLISTHGCFLVFPQDTAGVILHNPRSLIVNDQNLMPQVAMVQQSTQSFERVTGSRAQALMVFRQLVEPDELRAKRLFDSTVREWEIDTVKILTWESLKPYLQQFKSKTLQVEETVQLTLSLRKLALP
ncbi:hypothetical protein DC3_20180 [Deinococcus cellulosilyticus NBRC 106333 = KACC 11606]|uniref:Uncharacterized protein n=1 Tax=Deinococcus cellulosilyticus (strain DSM 18568 / NBRC 106333 / KACC 11606 / 5516J-15) TaxID=1223518 RepID=A0A511N0J9_DEIC1|nr:hypothetical protein DC3_20180 [Deinococcus cellulosilyticus NBRC 106333 = KACC 11606]